MWNSRARFEENLKLKIVYAIFLFLRVHILLTAIPKVLLSFERYQKNVNVAIKLILSRRKNFIDI
jgi:hypothetical protein